jgi:hypothetical protein
MLENDAILDDEGLIRFTNGYHISPFYFSQYEKKYQDYYEKKQRGEKINTEEAEFLQEILTREGRYFPHNYRLV